MNKQIDSEWVAAITKTVSFVFSPSQQKTFSNEPGIVLLMSFVGSRFTFPDHVSMFIYFLAAPATANWIGFGEADFGRFATTHSPD